MDQEEYIDLDKVLVDDELRSLVSTCEYNHKFRISLKSMDERKTERFRRSLVTPLSKYNTDWRTTTNKSPNDSCAESVALFKNLANNNEDHIDFVSSDLKDFMSSYDMDDLLSRPNSRVPALSHQKDVLTSSRLNNHNQATTLRHTNNSHMVPHKSSIINLSETIPRKHSFDSGQRKLSSPSIPVISDTSETQEINNNAKNQQFHRLLHKRRSVDSDALKKMKQADRDTKLKKPIVLVDKQKSIKHVSSTAIPTPKANRKSLLQQSDKRRWSSYIPDDMDLKKSPLISPKQGPVNTSRRTNNETLNRQKPFNSHLVSPQVRIQRKSLSDETRYQPKDSYLSESAERHFISNNDIPQREEKKRTNDILEKTAVDPALRRANRLNALATANRQRFSLDQRRLSLNRHSGHYVRQTENEEQPSRRTKPTPSEPPAIITSNGASYRLISDNKPSYMPVPVTRYRKHSNGSKYASVPEDEGLSFDAPNKEVRFSHANVIISHPDDVHIVASRSSGGLSNSTASSSHSGDLYYDPPTPPVNRTTAMAQKRRSMPMVNVSLIDEQVRKTEHRYSSYLARTKKNEEEEEEEMNLQPEPHYIRSRAISTGEGEDYAFRKKLGDHSLRRPSQREELVTEGYIPRRRVLSEDNKSQRRVSIVSSNDSSLVKTAPIQREYERSIYRHTVEDPPRRLQRGTSTENVTESARKVLAFVQQRRNLKHANQQAILNRRSLNL